MTSATTLLAFDFDGTLAPIQADPCAVRLSRGAAELLSEVSLLPRVVVAVVSGRDADDLAGRVGLPGTYIVASHGLEIRAPGGVVVRDAPRLDAALPIELQAEAAAAGLRLEEKKHALALHWRGIPYRAIEPVADGFRGWSRQRDLDVIEGRCVVEARRRGGGKGEALRWLMQATGADRVLYAGDDVTDFGALRIARGQGRGLFMASPEREAPPGVTVVASFRELFRIVREEARI